MPWQLDEFLSEKLERGRRLLAESDAHRGSTDLQKFVNHGDLTVQLHNLLLDDAMEPRQGLTIQDKQQAIVVLLLDALNSRTTAMSHSLMRLPCYEAAHLLSHEVSRSEDPVLQLMGRLGMLAIYAGALLHSTEKNAHLLPIMLSEGEQLAAMWPGISGAVDEFEQHQRQAGFSPIISALQLRTLPLLFQHHAVGRLHVTKTGQQQQQQLRDLAIAAADQQLQLGKGQDSAFLHWVKASMLIDKRPATEAVAELREALRCAEQEKAHLTSICARFGLATLLIRGGMGPNWSQSELLQIVQPVERELNFIKPWMTQTLMNALRQAQRSHLDVISGAAALAEPACLESVVGEACGGCGRRAAHLRRCTGCRTAMYCSRRCQVKAWKEGHQQACAKLAGRQTAAAAAGSGSSNNK